MQNRILSFTFAAAALALAGGVQAQSTAFTYQGRLADGGAPANGNYDPRFYLRDAATAGSPVGPTNTLAPVAVSNGLFTVVLDLGAGVFPGANRWLEIGVRTNGSAGSYTTLAPRQQITSTPYAITASNVTGALPAAQVTGALSSSALSGTYSGIVTFNNASDSFTGNGSGLTGLNASQLTSGTVPDARLAGNILRSNQAWLLSGNGGTSAGLDFLGTTDNQPVEFKVNNDRGLRLEPTTNSPNVIGGWSNNVVAPGVVGGTIGGGGTPFAEVFVSGSLTSSAFFTNQPNGVLADFGTIGGGFGNLITHGKVATIGGGLGNQIGGSSGASSGSTIAGGIGNGIFESDFDLVGNSIGGGSGNSISHNPTHSTIAGGLSNSIVYYAASGTIGGGSGNLIDSGGYATIAGGYFNTLNYLSGGSTIGGGSQNTVGAFLGGGGYHCVIAGGQGNLVQDLATYATVSGGQSNTTRGNYATVPGGLNNSALNNFSFAAGHRAKATNDGAFVWSDSNDFDFASTNANSFSVRATGGARFISAVNGSGTPVAGVTLFAGGGSWASLSDRNAKDHVAPVDVGGLLEKVAALPVHFWSYKSQTEATRHIGPMAQDFHAAFGVGESDTTITAIDADGVALAAIQGLNQKLEARLKQKDAEIAELRQAVAELKQLVTSPRKAD